ncbi:MAG: hypothetical protein JXN61_10435, partial [Sedimentisphaerales bacterium]|nr:hypothetical protein [Sedimentisphaerales bacterium]
AQGTYRPDEDTLHPDGTGDREATFQLINGVTLKGGYAGTGEPDPNVRSVGLYETILSGDLVGNDAPGFINGQENSYHVVWSELREPYSYPPADTLLDGFTITGGNADGQDWYDSVGGGILVEIDCAFTVRDCTIIGNRAEYGGGGMYNGYFTEIALTDCTFKANTASVGGAICGGDGGFITRCLLSGNLAHNGGAIAHCTAQLKDSIVSANKAEAYGGGIHIYECSQVLVNCVLAGNSAGYGGGALLIDGEEGGGKANLLNCTLVGNSAPRGNALATGLYEHEYPQAITVKNCILWDGDFEIWNEDASRILIEYSDLRGGASGVYDPALEVLWAGGNLDADPCFADPGYWDVNGTPEDTNDDFWVDGDYHLKSQAGRWNPNGGSWVWDDATSPCIDTGDQMDPIGSEPFPNGGRINMGAYGGTSEASKSYFGESPCQIIVAGDINGDCEVNFLDFRIMALHWMWEG